MLNQIPLCLPSLPNLLSQPFNQTANRNLSNLNLHARASGIKEQGFSETVGARIEAPQRGSIKSVYEAKWTIFTECCLSNQVDFTAPPIKSIADFLLYLFQEKNLQASTINSYIGQLLQTNWEICPLMSAKMRISLISWIVSTETEPRVERASLSGTFHWCCTSTKAPFEPIKEASLKHLTFKTVSLLALGSGKHRTEIHAW